MKGSEQKAVSRLEKASPSDIDSEARRLLTKSLLEGLSQGECKRVRRLMAAAKKHDGETIFNQAKPERNAVLLAAEWHKRAAQEAEKVFELLRSESGHTKETGQQRRTAGLRIKGAD
jgi:hypothetical protein